jgi:hypothetical protein
MLQNAVDSLLSVSYFPCQQIADTIREGIKMNIEAIIIEDSMKPSVTIKNAIDYAGHMMNVHIFEGASEMDISWGVEIVDSRTIEGGLYPHQHAEIGACYVISDELENLPEAQGLAESAKTLIEAIARAQGKVA